VLSIEHNTTVIHYEAHVPLSPQGEPGTFNPLPSVCYI